MLKEWMDWERFVREESRWLTDHTNLSVTQTAHGYHMDGTGAVGRLHKA